MSTDRVTDRDRALAVYRQRLEAQRTILRHQGEAIRRLGAELERLAAAHEDLTALWPAAPPGEDV